VCIVALQVDRRLSHVSFGCTSRSAGGYLAAHTVQRPLEQLIEGLLLCHGCLLCLIPALIAASVCCYEIQYTSILENTHTLLLISTTFCSASRRHPLTISHAAASKRQQINARASLKWDIDGQIKATRLVQLHSPIGPCFLPFTAPVSFIHRRHYSGRLWLWCSICQFDTRHLGAALGNSTIRRLGDQRRLFFSSIIIYNHSTLDDSRLSHDNHDIVVNN
jgi:hypothetical protein